MLRFDQTQIGSGRLIEWLTERVPIADLSLQEPPIERVVAEIYRRGLPEGPEGEGAAATPEGVKV